MLFNENDMVNIFYIKVTRYFNRISQIQYPEYEIK